MFLSKYTAETSTNETENNMNDKEKRCIVGMYNMYVQQIKRE